MIIISKFTKIPANTFKELQLNAGVFASNFNPKTSELKEEDLLGATSGGGNFSDTPTFSDWGEDIDNCPKNTKELKRIDNRDVVMSGTFVTMTAARAKSLIPGAKIDEADATRIIPHDTLTDADFEDIWWIGDYSDKNDDNNGGYIAIHLMNALSTGGFSVQSGDKSKGQFAFTYTGHYSIEDQSKVPYELFIKAGKG